MSSKLISDNIYSVGVMNPALRIFDIIMTAEYGTTYNAYLIKGEKNVLIEAVHSRFFDEYLENINEICNVQEIDFLIMNHTEPDHSGSIAKLLEINPNIVIYCSKPAHIYLKNIVRRPFECVEVTDGAVLDIGGRELKFITAPFLHWPDSMFTYDAASKTMFTCDFLGAHYCEPRLLDVLVSYPKAYDDCFEYYYNCIFSPFKPYVLAGLDKLDAHDIERICVSHGPILTESIGRRKEQYRAWSAPETKTGKLIAIAYASAYGYTKNLAEAAAEAVETAGYDCELIDIVTTPTQAVMKALDNSDAFLIGSNTINRDATKPVWDILSSFDAINTKKPVGAFGSYGWSGEAVGMVKSRLEQLRFKFIGDGFKVNFNPDGEALEKIRQYALEVAASIS